jgi:hypothetical protein
MIFAQEAPALQAVAAAAQAAQARAGVTVTCPACTGWRSARVLRGDARAQRGEAGADGMGWRGRAETDRRTAVSAARGLGCGRERGVQHALHVRIAEHAAPAQHSRRQPA